MYMNNKGFTLVEVLAVVVILAILMTITMPSVGYLVNKNNQDTYNNLKESIIVSSKMYFSENRYDVVLEKTCDNEDDIVNVKSIDNNGLEDSKVLIKYLTNNGNLSTNSNGNISNPLDTSLRLDLNNSYVVVKYQCSTKDFVYNLEDDYLIWQ